MPSVKSASDTENVSLGVFGRKTPFSGLTNAEIIALALSAVWLVGVTVFFFLAGAGETAETPPDPVRGLMVVLAIFMPLGLIWIATMAANSARAVRDESERLQAALDAMRQAYVAQNQAAGTAIKPSVEKKLDELVAAQRRTGEALATFTSIRHAAPATSHGPALGAAAPADQPVAQPSLGLSTRDDRQGEPVSIEDFISALHFPETPDDAEGFRALRRAMQDRRAAELIRASQDILTLLSQEGIYMDDLTPDRARPELWRRFAQGERGRTVAALGGIRDRSGIALTAARMRQDHVFRDAAHHFLRKFDQVFQEFETHATDAEIVALADTRTARAFMLLGRVAGTFD